MGKPTFSHLCWTPSVIRGEFWHFHHYKREIQLFNLQQDTFKRAWDLSLDWNISVNLLKYIIIFKSRMTAYLHKRYVWRLHRQTSPLWKIIFPIKLKWFCFLVNISNWLHYLFIQLKQSLAEFNIIHLELTSTAEETKNLMKTAVFLYSNYVYYLSAVCSWNFYLLLNYFLFP